MKKYCLLIVALAALFVSCSKDNGTSVLKIKAQKYTQAGDSKVVLENNYAVWAPGDVVMINDVTKTITETGNDIEIEVDTADSYTLVYPSSFGHPNGAANISVSLPNVQNYQSYNGVQNIAAPMVGYASGSRPDEMKLHNVCALVKFNILNYFMQRNSTVQVKEISMSNIGSNLCGSGVVGNVSTTPTLAMGPLDPFFGAVSLKCEGSPSISRMNAGSFYLVVPPVECAEGSTWVDVKYRYSGATVDSMYYLDLNRNITFEAGKIYTVKIILN